MIIEVDISGAITLTFELIAAFLSDG
jgi:hypothetical protein